MSTTASEIRNDTKVIGAMISSLISVFTPAARLMVHKLTWANLLCCGTWAMELDKAGTAAGEDILRSAIDAAAL